MSDEPKNPQGDGWKSLGAGHPRQPNFVLQQSGHLVRIQKILEDVVQQKQAEVAHLQEKLMRLKHGGGS